MRCKTNAFEKCFTHCRLLAVCVYTRSSWLVPQSCWLKLREELMEHAGLLAALPGCMGWLGQARSSSRSSGGIRAGHGACRSRGRASGMTLARATVCAGSSAVPHKHTRLHNHRHSRCRQLAIRGGFAARHHTRRAGHQNRQGSGARSSSTTTRGHTVSGQRAGCCPHRRKFWQLAKDRPC